MVYLYKKTIGNKDYYYLRASAKKDGKQVTKDIAYLGSDPSKIKEKLESLPQVQQKAIRKAYKTIHKFVEVNHYEEKIKSLKLKKNPYLTQKQLQTIEACNLHWNHSFAALDTHSKEELLNDFVIDFSFNTTSIEGNTITLKEAEQLFLHDRTPKDRTLREVYDLQNTKKVFFRYFEQVPKNITHDLIKEIHSGLLENVDARTGYRHMDIRVTKSRFSSSPAQYVKTDMDLLLKWYEDHKDKLHPFVFARLFHHKFEHIHPFFDGNGRTGRMLMNIMLLSSGYPPLIIRKKKRSVYLNALSKADVSDMSDSSPELFQALIDFCAEEYVTNYWAVFL